MKAWLQWEMESAPIRRQMRLQKRDADPEEQRILDAQPEQDEAMAVCLQAWRDLSTCRPLGFSGAGPIPWTALVAWLDRSGLDAGAASVVQAVIARLDNDFLDAQASERAQQLAKRGSHG